MSITPMFVYLLGMTIIVVLAVIFCLSLRYYIKAKDLVPYLHKIKELVEKIEELTHKVDDKEKELKDMAQKIADAEIQIAKGKSAEEWLKKSKEEIDTTQQILEKIRAEMEIAKAQKEDLDRQVSERQQKMADLAKMVREAEQRVKDAEKEVEAIRKENAELGVQVPRLRAELADLKTQIEQKANDLDELNKKIKEQNEILNTARGEVERLQGLIDAKKTELENLNQECKAAANEKARIAGETAELEAQANVAKGVIADMKARREVSDEIWKNLDTPVVKQENIRADGEYLIDEEDWLEEFGEKLAGHGFIFDERAIRAFHTGLKCAQQTPLVVLAGISGTGKSLLPELYSAASGMNFLPVPVQPRWDSPQDLFGFYNYMEGRYKATELARLLWQFDWYNNNKSVKKHFNKRTLPLNLVLLDEMNLARVEYYFSDLLSKLETRNGLDPEIPLERAKAEIELECNAAGTDDSMRHIFVSPYTLFVGTMNEDESTQTLSDKVIDRSNVLRFGRPKMLSEDSDEPVIEPDKSGFIQDFSDSPRVTAEDWDGWCKKLDDAEEDDERLAFLKETVTPVVEVLDKVYRSYGFRVDKAMKLYVLNYPGEYKEAVADQIEMKILPKLNGIELQDEHFGEVKSVLLTAIAKTEDKKLQRAFEEACPESGTFFKWRGVMR